MQEIKSALVSIIIPCFNAELFIKDTIESIADQSYQNFEIILVDDGSTDMSADVIKSLNHPRLTYHYQKNAGVSAARNNGLRLASGEFVVFFDADDLMTKRFLENRVKLLNDHEAISFSCGLVKNFGINNHNSKGSIDPFKEVLTYDTSVSTCPSNYLIKHSFIIEKQLEFSTFLSSTADKYFLIEVAQNGGKGMITKENDSELLYRVAEGSMSNKLTDKLVQDNEVYFDLVRSKSQLPNEEHTIFKQKTTYILSAANFKINRYLRSTKYLLKHLKYKL